MSIILTERKEGREKERNREREQERKKRISLLFKTPKYTQAVRVEIF